MGGAALMLALSHVIISANLPVRLRVLLPAVENAVSGNAYRPGDILSTRAGLTVENGNTDAEGRLILCDAIFEAASSAPDVLIDAATLTGGFAAALNWQAVRKSQLFLAVKVALGWLLAMRFCIVQHSAARIYCSSNAIHILLQQQCYSSCCQLGRNIKCDFVVPNHHVHTARSACPFSCLSSPF